MPFGRINAGATFQQTMDIIFSSQIGRNLQVCVDEMITKSKYADSHPDDLQETFENMRKYQVKSNPTKCSFGLTSGKFLGFLLTQRGIEVDPLQIKAILDMKDLTSLKDVQSLTGCIAALRRFIPQSSKRCLPFFKNIKGAAKNTKLDWNEDCKNSLTELKKFLTSPPILAKASPGRTSQGLSIS